MATKSLRWSVPLIHCFPSNCVYNNTPQHITAQFKVKSTLFLRFILHSRKIINQTETFDLLLTSQETSSKEVKETCQERHF